MAQTFTIGRNGNQPFKIAAPGVSGTHAEIHIDYSGRWHLRDLNSTNGTYMRIEDGSFVRIGHITIDEDTIVRLGAGSHQSYTFMAHRVLEPDGVYGYEFARLCEALSEQEKREAHMRKTIKDHNIMSIASGAVVGLLFFVVTALIDIPQEQMSLVTGLRVAIFPIVGAVVKLLFSGDADKLRQVVERRKTFLVCPKCQRALTDYDINNMACPYCKAK